MRIALPEWNGRLSPVFDTSRGLAIADCSQSGAVTWRREMLPPETPGQRAERLAGLAVDVLLCGAVSSSLVAEIEQQGIEVVPFLTGLTEEILRAWLGGRIERPCYRMPGCRGRRRRGGRRNGSPGGRCMGSERPEY